MKQLLQSLKDGSTEIAEVPAPGVSRGHLLVQTRVSLVSAGTERMLVEFGKANWLDKARQQPDKVRMVLDKARTDGVQATLDAVRSKLDQPLALGYCNVGAVLEVGDGVQGFAMGDRVVSNGKHAEIVRVPVNLAARIPDNVSDDAAAFTVLAAIGLQGIRLAQPTLGESVVVTGLGLIGLITVQMLRAQGCRVLGIDFDPARLEMARRFGAETLDAGNGADIVEQALSWSRGRGVDAVLITASTQSSEPVSQAARMCRKRGRIVLVGVTGLELSRADFYEKELSFQVSCSYGPGRYDPAYEEGGQDYPVGFVRWTEQRNFEAVLDLMSAGALDVAPLITHRHRLEDAAEAYVLLAGGEPSLGILLDYPTPAEGEIRTARRVSLASAGETTAVQTARTTGTPRIAFLGAGNYAGRVLIPAFKAAGADLRTVVSAGGVSATHYGRKFGFDEASTDSAAVWSDANIDAVVVATRHDGHARAVLQALESGKHVFVEKPLCLNEEEADAIEAALARNDRLLMVGFNRRFSPHVRRMQALLAPLSAPRHLVATVNAGAIPAEHWTQDRAVGGGRIVGEGCHFIDLLRHLAGAPINDIDAIRLGMAGDRATADSAALTLRFANGSTGVVNYLANGHRAFPKERVEVFCAGRVLQLDNFRRLRGWGWPGFGKLSTWRQDKGQAACAAAFVDTLRSGAAAPISPAELLEVARASIRAQALVDGGGAQA